MSKSFKTFLKHTAKDYHNQSVNPPVVRASTIIFKSMKDIRKMQNKAKKILQVDTLIMVGKELQLLIFFQKFLQRWKRVITFLQHQLDLVQFF